MRRSRVVVAVGTAQTLAWASSYYLPAVLADSIASTLALSRTWVFGAFSIALTASASQTFAVSLWSAWTERRSLSVALQDELASFGMLSVASATTAVMIVLSREAVGLWGPFLFALPLVLSIAAARRYAQTRRTYRDHWAARVVA